MGSARFQRAHKTWVEINSASIQQPDGARLTVGEPILLDSSHRSWFKTEAEFQAALQKQSLEREEILRNTPAPWSIMLLWTLIDAAAPCVLLLAIVALWQFFFRPTFGALWKWTLDRRSELR